MVEEPSEQSKAEQREAQRLLGRCMLRLQQYERLLKAMLVDHEFEGPILDFDSIRAERERRTGRKTLGNLVGDFLGSYLVGGEPQDLPEGADDANDGPSTFRFRLQVALPLEVYAQTVRDLKELVNLRNMLVHDFINQHDLWSVEGCCRAQLALVDAYENIDAHYGRLVELAKENYAIRMAMQDKMQSEAFREAVVKGYDEPRPTKQ